MNTKLCTLALSLYLSAECVAQVSEPSETTAAFFAEMRKGGEEQQKLRDIAAASDKSVAALRADLASPWTSVIIAYRHDDSRAGTSYSGFLLSRAGESVTVVPWDEMEGKASTGETRPITKAELERLLSETALFYLAASLSVAPVEKAGPRPSDPDKAGEWRQRYRAAGGSTTGRMGNTDDYGMDVRVATPGGLKQHSNMWGNDCPDDFVSWITAFGTLRVGVGVFLHQD